jgi:spore germination cell wall hydrolase CwlJ-like protein
MEYRVTVRGKPIAAAIAIALLSGAALVPYSGVLGSESSAPSVPVVGPVEAHSTAAPVVDLAPILDVANDVASPPVVEAEPAPVVQADDRELHCLAKIVHHESANQPRVGQLAVAQVVMNRVRSGRFASTICAVGMQRGQFFNVHAYNPPQDRRWRVALEVAREARAGTSEPVVGDALFFHAAYARPFNRHRVTQIGDHIFYQ